MENNTNIFEVSSDKRVTFNSYVQGSRAPSIIVNIDGEEFFLTDILNTLLSVKEAPKLIFSPLVDKLIEIRVLTNYDDEGFVTRNNNFEKLQNRLDKIVSVG